MAKQYETNSLGFPLKFSGPDSVEDYDRQAGRVGACLEDAVENTIYRSTLPEFQDEFSKRVATLTDTERQVNKTATESARTRSKNPEKVKDIMETVKTYVNRVTAGMSDEDKTALATMAQEVASGIAVDPSPSKRAAGIPKEYRAKAESILTLPDDQIEAKLTKWADQYPEIDVTSVERDENGKPTVESLAALVRQIVTSV